MIDNLNKLRDDVYRIACEHGWHEEEKSPQHWAMLIVSELAEAVEADRKGKHASIEQYDFDIDYALHELKVGCDRIEEHMKMSFEKNIKDSFEDELADVVIRTLDFAGVYNMDLDSMPNPFSDELLPHLVIKIGKMSVTEWAFYCTDILIECIDDDILHGDIVIFLHRIWLMCRREGIDLEWHIKEKVKYNKGREYKHGKRY